MPTPRQKRRTRRLRQIRDEAMALIVRDGIDSFSIHALADRLDLTPGALYRYYDSRDAILAAVEVEVLEAFDAYFQALARRTADEGGLRLLVIFAAGYMALQDLQPERFRLISQFVAGPDPILDDALAADVVGPTLRVVGHFVTALDVAAGDGGLGDGDAMTRAALTWSSLQGLINHRKLTRLPQVPLDPDALFNELLTALFTGWGAPPESLTEALQGRPDLDFFATVLEESS